MTMQLGKTEKIKVGMPAMGAYGQLLEKSINKSFKEVGIDNLIELNIAPPITKKTINRGSQHMDENMCLPGKITFGNILDLYDRGNKIILEWDNCGDCRQKAYGLLHQSKLRQLGIDVKILTLKPDDMIGWLLEIIPNLAKSKQKRLIRNALRDVWEFDVEFMRRQTVIPGDAPKIGICGEIYTVLEPAANVGLLDKLKEQGAFVHNSLPLSQFLFHHLLDGEKRFSWSKNFAYLGMFRELRKWCLRKMERPDVNYEIMQKAKIITEKYLPGHTVGGHGKESVTWAIYYALSGFDGVVHIMPFPCMPEATVTTLMDEVSKDFGIPVNHLVFDQQFGEQNLITRAEATVNMLRFKKDGLTAVLETRRPGLWLGLDVGSTSTKAVLLDGQTLEIVDAEYQLTHREPIDSIKRVVSAIKSRHPQRKISGGSTTGSGRRLAKSLLDAPLAVDEISCQVVGCMITNPSVRSIIEIGGQDSKYIRLDKTGVPSWFNMNSICSAGTGAFLSSAAREFKMPIEDLGSCARSASCGVSITGRCGVFAESDIVSKQQAGYPVNRIVKGMCNALAQNYLSNVCRSEKLHGPIMFTGAVALNEGVVDAFSHLTEQEVLVHPHQRVSGALGAAFIALVRGAEGGFNICDAETQFGSHMFNCGDCSNECEVSLIYRDDIVVCALGSRCGKYDKFSGKNLKAVKAKIKE